MEIREDVNTAPRSKFYPLLDFQWHICHFQIIYFYSYWGNIKIRRKNTTGKCGIASWFRNQETINTEESAKVVTTLSSLFYSLYDHKCYKSLRQEPSSWNIGDYTKQKNRGDFIILFCIIFLLQSIQFQFPFL